MTGQSKALRSLFRVALAGVTLLSGSLKAQVGSGLRVTYGSNGIQQLVYNGVLLEDLGQSPADQFHIWHISSTDLAGNVVSSGQYGWGEVNNGRTWNPSTTTWTYSFVWGAVTVRFAQAGSATLNVHVTETNNPGSGIVLNGINIYPFVLHFPNLPAGFTDPSYAQVSSNATGPAVTVADYGMGEVAAVDADAVKPSYSGFLPAGAANSYTPVIASTSIDNLPSFYPSINRPLWPGQTDQFMISLRFAQSGTPSAALASDAFQNWQTEWPAALVWTDRRPIGTVYLASSPQGDPSQASGYPNNPRRYYNDNNPSDFDITTPNGLAAFQTRILQQAIINSQNAQQLNSQGIITWDIEGEQYPQPTSYVCEPDEILSIAPEMESVITDPASGYFGMKLDDAYFQIIRSAGLRVGVCTRPQHFTLNPDGTAGQLTLPGNGQIVAELARKIKYAHDRWGATLFYVDSNVDGTGAPLNPDIFQQVAESFPDSLIIPEHSTPKYFAYTAPFLSFLFLNQVSTPAAVYNAYPFAFSANLVNDADPFTLAQSVPVLTSAVGRGDILMGHVDYWQANDPVIAQIYRDAGPAPMPPSAPGNPSSPITVVGVTAGQVLAGTVTISAQTSRDIGTGTCVLTVDGQPTAPMNALSPFLFQLDTTGISNGWHTLQVIAQQGHTRTTLRSRSVQAIIRN